MDGPHGEAERLFGEIFRLIREGSDRHAVCDVVERLNRVLVDHFQAEEGAMGEAGYPDLPAHRAQHDEFLKYFNRLRQRAQCVGTASELDRHTLQYLHDWFFNHLREADQRLASHLRGSGRRWDAPDDPEGGPVGNGG